MRTKFLSLSLLSFILLISCQSEDFPETMVSEKGSISFNINLISGSAVSKSDVPDCSENEPVFIQITYDDDKIFTSQFANGRPVEPLTLSIGNHVINDINILDADSVIIYHVPNENDERFDLSSFVSSTTPVNVNIAPNVERELFFDAVCYSPDEVLISASILGISLYEFVPFALVLPFKNVSCYDELLIMVNGGEIRKQFDDYETREREIIYLPIPKDIIWNPDGGQGLAFYLLKNGEEVYYEFYGEYNIDGILTESDILNLYEWSCN